MSEPNKFYTGSDLIVFHAEGHYSEFVFVTFSARNEYGDGKIFGDKFLNNLNVEAFYICQTGGNHWWHTPEILTVVKLINSITSKASKKIILYGSSMGGYAAYHLRNFFDSFFSICIAPQIFINLKINSLEKRWLTDLTNIQDRFVFDELENSRIQTGECVIFYDPYHILDCQHVKLHNEFVDCCKNNLNPIFLFEVPYANHDLARLLVNTKTIQKFIMSLLKRDRGDFIDIKKACYSLYESDPKAFSDYFRHEFKNLNELAQSSLISKLEIFMRQRDALDFEALYMMSECLLKIGRISEALIYIDLSISRFELKYNKEPPSYLYMKRENIKKTRLS